MLGDKQGRLFALRSEMGGIEMERGPSAVHMNPGEHGIGWNHRKVGGHCSRRKRSLGYMNPNLADGDHDSMCQQDVVGHDGVETSTTYDIGRNALSAWRSVGQYLWHPALDLESWIFSALIRCCFILGAAVSSSARMQQERPEMTHHPWRNDKTLALGKVGAHSMRCHCWLTQSAVGY